MYKKLDFHAHAGYSPAGHDKDGRKNSVKQLLRSMRKHGVRESVVFPLDEKYTTVEDASLVLRDRTEDLPLYPFFRFDPKGMTEERLKVILNGFYGIKLHPRAQDFDPLDEKFFPLYDVISKSEKPLLMHTRYQCPHDKPGEVYPNMNPDVIIGLAKHFPEMHFVLAHFGNGSRFVQQEIKKYPRVYMDTSILGVTPVTLADAVDYIGADRLLYGSDIPYAGERGYVEAQINNIVRSRLSKKDKEKILYHNARHLLHQE